MICPNTVLPPIAGSSSRSGLTDRCSALSKNWACTTFNKCANALSAKSRRWQTFSLNNSPLSRGNIFGNTPRLDLIEDGTVKLSEAWQAGSGPVSSRNELASRQVALCRLPLPGRGDQPSRLALLLLPAQPAHGRGDAGGARHPRQP